MVQIDSEKLMGFYLFTYFLNTRVSCGFMYYAFTVGEEVQENFEIFKASGFFYQF